MKRLIVITLVIILASCNQRMQTPVLNTTKTTVAELNGKWENKSVSTNILFEETINKVVLSDGCQVVSADYSRYQDAISFTNITASKENCPVSISLENILKQTVRLKSQGANTLAFLDQGGNELFIVNKN